MPTIMECNPGQLGLPIPIPVMARVRVSAGTSKGGTEHGKRAALGAFSVFEAVVG